MTANSVSADLGARTTGINPNAVEPLDTVHQLRNLLARRLMRVGSFKAALPYFSTSDQKIIGSVGAYAAAVQAARATKAPIDKAEALFKAGLLARKQGMELLGYELAPDFHYAKGNYAADSVLNFNKETGSSAQVFGRLSMSEGEVRFFDVTVPRIDKRYHYRYLAVEKAREAARLLPARSQAYCSVLCHAAAWAPDRELYSDLYKTYLRNGSSLNYPLAGLFGRRCETPDFEGARWFNSKRKAKGN